MPLATVQGDGEAREGVNSIKSALPGGRSRQRAGCQKSLVGGVGGTAVPPTAIVSRGFAARAGRFRPQPKPFLTFFMAVSLG